MADHDARGALKRVLRRIRNRRKDEGVAGSPRGADPAGGAETATDGTVSATKRRHRRPKGFKTYPEA
jgi:hypothetical protein